MKTFLILVASTVCFSSVANAQLTSQNEAKYIATLKAVVNYKIDDEENALTNKIIPPIKAHNATTNKIIETVSNVPLP